MASQHVLYSCLCNPKIEFSSRRKTQTIQSKCTGKLSWTGLSLKWVRNDFSTSRLKRGLRANASISDVVKKVVLGRDFDDVTVKENDGLEPFRGKPGSISFYGLTHQVVEEGNLESSPSKPGSGSFLWLGGSTVLMMSYVLPPVLIGSVVSIMIKDMTLAEIVVSFSSEAAFFTGFATFLIITDRVQRPYLQYSPKRWSLITHLRGYSISALIIAVLKIVIPIYATYVSWPELGLKGLVTVAPFIIGCVAQFMFEVSVRIRGSSCWHLVPIIFEMYRIYQVTRGVYFIERLVYAMGDLPKTPQLIERGNALVGLVVMLQVIALVCLWSLITFLVRLFPSESF